MSQQKENGKILRQAINYGMNESFCNFYNNSDGSVECQVDYFDVNLDFVISVSVVFIPNKKIYYHAGVTFNGYPVQVDFKTQTWTHRVLSEFQIMQKLKENMV